MFSDALDAGNERELVELEQCELGGGDNTLAGTCAFSYDACRVSALPKNLEMSPSKSTSVSDSTIKRKTEPKKNFGLRLSLPLTNR